MSFSIPHRMIDQILPARTGIKRADWTGLIRRADQMDMGRLDEHNYRLQDCRTFNDGASDEYEGDFLRTLAGERHAQRLFPSEAALVPLFHAVTRQPKNIAPSYTDTNYPSIAWESVVSGSAEGIDLKELARRVATTALESKDGDSTDLHLLSLSDAEKAHTPAEQKAMRALLPYFARDTTIHSMTNQKGVNVFFDVHKVPTQFESCGPNKAKYFFDVSLKQMRVQAPEGSRVSWVPSDSCGRLLSEDINVADVGASGEVTFPVNNLPKGTERMLMYVTYDPDGCGSAKPQLLASGDLQMPGTKTTWTADKTARRQQLISASE